MKPTPRPTEFPENSPSDDRTPTRPSLAQDLTRQLTAASEKATLTAKHLAKVENRNHDATNSNSACVTLLLAALDSLARIKATLYAHDAATIEKGRKLADIPADRKAAPSRPDSLGTAMDARLGPPDADAEAATRPTKIRRFIYE